MTNWSAARISEGSVVDNGHVVDHCPVAAGPSVSVHCLLSAVQQRSSVVASCVASGDLIRRLSNGE